jgi:hypothetical protein
LKRTAQPRRIQRRIASDAYLWQYCRAVTVALPCNSYRDAEHQQKCKLPTIQVCALGMDIARTIEAGIDPGPCRLLLHTTKEFSMAQSKSTRTHARASAAGAAGSKRTRRTRNTSTTGHSSKQQRSANATTSTRKKGRSGAPTVPNKPAPRRTPNEYDPESGVVEPGGNKPPRGGRSDESIDEETGALSKRPGGTGDASFGDNDEGPEGPAR